MAAISAALSALRLGKRAIVTEETDWIGGQLTQQGVPPDENRWIESHGCTASYRQLRDGIRNHYRRHLPLRRRRWCLRCRRLRCSIRSRRTHHS